MRRRGLVTAWVLGCLCLSLAVWGNEAPTMEDQTVTTMEGQPVTIRVLATDPDIDPVRPEEHPLEFWLLEGPLHGVLSNGFAEVTYIGPHDAYIELRYVPARGYVGTDVVKVAVVDPYNKTATGTTTIRIDVTARPLVGLMSGLWQTSISYDVQSRAVSALWTRVSETYRVGKLTLSAIADWRYDVEPPTDDELDVLFDALRFQGSLRFDTFDVNTTLAFDPTPQTTSDSVFDYWRASVRHELFGVTFQETFYLAEPENSYVSTYARGELCGVEFTNLLTLGFSEACELGFERESLRTSWAWCDLTFRSAVLFTCDEGFEEWTLKLDDYAIPFFTWETGGVYLDITVGFDATSKWVTPSFSLKTKWMDCVRLYGEVVSGPTGWSVDQVSVYGLRIQHTFENGIRLVTATAFDGAVGAETNHNSQMTGQVDYFEVVSLSGTTMSCCGRPGTWRVATYFVYDGARGFDWGMTEVGADVYLGKELSVSLDVVYRSGEYEDPKLELELGWKLRW